MDADLARQRRNLMIISAVMWLLSASDAHLESVTALSVSIKVNQPNAIYVGLWALFSYFLYRYVVFFVTRAQSGVAAYVQEQLKATLHGATFRLFTQQYPGGSATGDWPSTEELWRNRGRTGLRYRDSSGQEHDRFIVLEGARAHMVFAVIARITRMLLAESMVTDYLLPAAFAVAVAVYAASSNWPGSVSNLFAAFS